jgi:exosortase
MLSTLTFVVLCLGIVTAFRAILVAPFGLTDPGEFEYWFFIPNRDSGALSVLVSAWFLWNRRQRLLDPSTDPIGWPYWISAAVILSAFFWAIWVSAQALLIPVLCLTLATLASAWGGRTALQLMVMPCAALMLAFPPPAPIQAEIIWRLQNLTADGAALVLALFGYAPRLEGTELRLGSHIFVIIEACSGWRGIQVLSIVALVASELRALRFRRMLWVVVAAIPLGIGLNILRACLVMLTQEEIKAEFFESHTPQGIAVLLIGAVALYAFAMKLDDASEAAIEPGTYLPDAGVRESAPVQSSRWLAIGMAVPLVLVGISILIPNLREAPEPPVRGRVGFPLSVKQWTGKKIPIDYFFPYSTPANPQFHAEYRKTTAKGGERLVDLFIAWETPKPSGLDRMPDAKLLLPTNDWNLDSRRPAKVWQFGFDAEEAIVARGDPAKFSYVIAWRVRDRGLFGESLLSLVGLRGCAEFDHGCPRVVVRITVPIFGDHEDGREFAKKTANKFIDDLIFPLKLITVR